MKKRKTKDVYRHLNDEFGRCLAGAFQSKFGVSVETGWSIINNQMITSRADNKPLTITQRDYIAAYENGYFQAAHEATNDR